MITGIRGARSTSPLVPGGFVPNTNHYRALTTCAATPAFGR
jgi:hypothetical protein